MFVKCNNLVVLFCLGSALISLVSPRKTTLADRLDASTDVTATTASADPSETTSTNVTATSSPNPSESTTVSNGTSTVNGTSSTLHLSTTTWSPQPVTTKKPGGTVWKKLLIIVGLFCLISVCFRVLYYVYKVITADPSGVIADQVGGPRDPGKMDGIVYKSASTVPIKEPRMDHHKKSVASPVYSKSQASAPGSGGGPMSSRQGSGPYSNQAASFISNNGSSAVSSRLMDYSVSPSSSTSVMDRKTPPVPNFMLKSSNV